MIYMHEGHGTGYEGAKCEMCGHPEHKGKKCACGREHD